MPNRICRLSTLVLLFVAAPGSLRAQCRPLDDGGDYLVRLVKTYGEATDSTWKAHRDSLRIAPAAHGGVMLITKAATCAAANAAYQKEALGDRTSFSGQVYVVQSGTTYVVWDPTYRYVRGGFPSRMVFDSKWGLKAKF